MINYNGDKAYPSSTTNTYCENKNYPPLISTGNALNVLYDNRNKLSQGFVLEYSVVWVSVIEFGKYVFNNEILPL